MDKKNVPEKFITGFEQEYIKKAAEWYYGTAFAGKSRSNNSVESGNKILKDHFNRKAHNVKGFIVKIKDFWREYSTLEKTTFPENHEFDQKIKKDAQKIAQSNSLLKAEDYPDFLFYPRKGINKDGLQEMLVVRISRQGLLNLLKNSLALGANLGQ